MAKLVDAYDLKSYLAGCWFKSSYKHIKKFKKFLLLKKRYFRKVQRYFFFRLEQKNKKIIYKFPKNYIKIKFFNYNSTEVYAHTNLLKILFGTKIINKYTNR